MTHANRFSPSTHHVLLRRLLGDPSADIPLARATIADAQNELKAQSPWLVSQVCKRWRDVALSPSTIYGIEQTLPQLKLHLARSGNARLHPELVYSTREAASFLAPLVESSDRWVTLILALQWTVLQDKLVPLKGNLGALEELQIEGIKKGGTALAEGDRFDSFAIAPRLRKLSVKKRVRARRTYRSCCRGTSLRTIIPSPARMSTSGS